MHSTSSNSPNIILIGFMGSGKSSIGKILASMLNTKFIDLDEYILDTTGAPSINSLFAHLGEAEFRKIELKAFLEANTEQGVVIATGGGTLVSDASLDLDLKNAHIIYLETDFDICKSRAGKNNRRPLFKDPDKAEELYSKRKPLYEKIATITILCDGSPAKIIAEKIRSSLPNS